MTPKDLLKPRYKVVADYPGNVLYSIGSILPNIWPSYCKYLDKYPHLFKKLEWWEERDKKDLPVYIRIIDENKVVEVERHSPDIGFSFNGRRKVYSNNTAPATKEEYLNQSN